MINFEFKPFYANNYLVNYFQFIYDICLVRAPQESEFKAVAGRADKLGGGIF